MNKIIPLGIGIGILLLLNSKKPKGILTNNPGNIRYNPNNNWKGQIGVNEGFVVFNNPQNGIRAMTKVLNSYRKKGFTTIAQIITRWAPPHENKTLNYVNFVANALHTTPAHVINDSDYLRLIKAIIKIENGKQPFSNRFIENSIKLA